MNILILGNTAGLTNDFILKTFPNQAVFIFGHTGVKNSRKNKITVYTKHYENNQLEDVFDFMIMIKSSIFRNISIMDMKVQGRLKISSDC